jgi:4'-phosphopantetheinyl transferase
MDVYWFQQAEADVPATDDWLSENEAVRLSSFRFAKRRNDWRLGRWTAKCAIAASLKLPNDPRSLSRIEITPAASGQPEVTLHDQTETVTISISHRGGLGLCAVALGDIRLGCDLEMIEPRSDAFTADYFTEKEQKIIAQTSGAERPLLVSLLWSAKESALKALHVGLRADTRCVEIKELDLQGNWYGVTDAPSTEGSLPSGLSNITAASWRALQVQYAGGADFCGWWQHSNKIVRTIVATLPPVLTRTSSYVDGIELVGLGVQSAGQ